MSGNGGDCPSCRLCRTARMTRAARAGCLGRCHRCPCRGRRRSRRGRQAAPRNDVDEVDGMPPAHAAACAPRPDDGAAAGATRARPGGSWRRPAQKHQRPSTATGQRCGRPKATARGGPGPMSERATREARNGAAQPLQTPLPSIPTLRSPTPERGQRQHVQKTDPRPLVVMMMMKMTMVMMVVT